MNRTSDEVNGEPPDWRRVSAAGVLILLALLIGPSVGLLVGNIAEPNWVQAAGTWVAALFTGGGFYAAFIELRRGGAAQETARAEARTEELETPREAWSQSASRKEDGVSARRALVAMATIYLRWPKHGRLHRRIAICSLVG